MPLITPNNTESEKEFVSRFMGDKAMFAEYPDQQQRLAIAYSQYKRKARKMEFAQILKGGAGSGKKGHKTVKAYAAKEGYSTKNFVTGPKYSKVGYNEADVNKSHNAAHAHLTSNGFTQTAPGEYKHDDGTKVTSARMSEHHAKKGVIHSHVMQVVSPLE